MRDISDGICAYVVGGLGNQLFILAAAWAQAARLDCPLYIDTSWYSLAGSEYASELDDLSHPGLEISQVSPWRLVSLLGQRPGLRYVYADSAHLRRRTRLMGARRLPIYVESGFAYDPAVNTVPLGTTMVGYYQSARYFAGIADRVAGMLTSVGMTQHESACLDRAARQPRAAIHVRRGDYTDSKNAFIGLAEGGYYRRAVALYERLHPGTRFHMYSDSYDVAAAQLDRVEGVELAPDDHGLRSVATLLAMSSAQGLIIANSSFSWWAAWLIARRDPRATVIAPRPWFADGDSAADLLLPDWITLDRRS